MNTKKQGNSSPDLRILHPVKVRTLQASSKVLILQARLVLPYWKLPGKESLSYAYLAGRDFKLCHVHICFSSSFPTFLLSPLPYLQYFLPFLHLLTSSQALLQILCSKHCIPSTVCVFPPRTLAFHLTHFACQLHGRFFLFSEARSQ